MNKDFLYLIVLLTTTLYAKPALDGPLKVEWILSSTKRHAGNGIEIPQTHIKLFVKEFLSKAIDAGTYDGNCSSESDDAEANNSLHCWWAGSGDSLVVLKSNSSTLMIKHQSLSEGADAGPWTVVKTISK